MRFFDFRTASLGFSLLGLQPPLLSLFCGSFLFSLSHQNWRARGIFFLPFSPHPSRFLGRLQIRCCCKLWHRSKTCLRSSVGEAIPSCNLNTICGYDANSSNPPRPLLKSYSYTHLPTQPLYLEGSQIFRLNVSKPNSWLPPSPPQTRSTPAVPVPRNGTPAFQLLRPFLGLPLPWRSSQFFYSGRMDSLGIPAGTTSPNAPPQVTLAILWSLKCSRHTCQPQPRCCCFFFFAF